MPHHIKLIAITRGRRYAVILAILDDLQQPLQPIAANPGCSIRSSDKVLGTLPTIISPFLGDQSGMHCHVGRQAAT